MELENGMDHKNVGKLYKILIGDCQWKDQLEDKMWLEGQYEDTYLVL
jgi:hypothetical protein